MSTPTLVEIKQQRRKAEKVIGPFAKAMLACMRDYKQARAEGLSQAEAVKGIEAVVREVWPRPRSEPWRYLCNACGDTGWQEVMRHSRIYGEDVPYVDYCTCQEGQRMRLGHNPVKSPETEASNVAKRWRA